MFNATAVASECRYSNAEDLRESVAARLWQLVDEAVTLRDSVSLILAGGSTPIPVYNLLRELPLPWQGMRICPSDERWVDVNDPASNEGMLKREFYGDKPVQFVSLAKHSETVTADAANCNRQLARHETPWDVVVLGMGADGHTASLFPGSDDLEVALNSDRLCVPVMPADAAHQRLSLTPQALLNARRIVLLISGARKWQVYQDAINGTDPSELPVRVILHQDRVPVDVYWSV